MLLLVIGVSQVHAQAWAEKPTQIFIPGAKINLPVKSAKIAYNTWEVSNTTASFGEGSSLPGTIGNTVIFAHAREGLFGNLAAAEENQLIYIFTDHNWYSYRIKETLVVPPTDIDVIKKSEGAELTLFTCTGPHDSHRLVIKAILEK